jgi:CRISPR system Cascade subunit CasA
VTNYNLIEQPWIAVLNQRGAVETVSIKQLFEKAHIYQSLNNELPTVDFAILRLLLAIMYGAFLPKSSELSHQISTERSAINFWKSIWDKESFDSLRVVQYLDKYYGRFDLFSKSTPFMQNVDLKPKAGSAKADQGGFNVITGIIQIAPSRIERRYFTERIHEGATSLEFDEAARWLVTLQAYDYAGKKSSTEGGTPDGGGTGWLGKIGGVYNLGKNLFETLMLNFMILDNNSEPIYGENYWEKPYLSGSQKRDLVPNNFVDLLTWQSRRCLLKVENDKVAGYLVTYGDVFEKYNMGNKELMCGWHKSSVKVKSLADNPMIPNKFDQSRQVWRDLSALLTENESNTCPFVVKWTGKLLDKDAIENQIVHVQTVGVNYGAMEANIQEIVSDSLTLNSALFKKLSLEIQSLVLHLLEITNQAVQRYSWFCVDLAKAAGAGSNSSDPVLDSVRTDARTEAYAAFDIPFRRWLADLDGTDLDAPTVFWLNKIRSVMHDLIDKRFNRASEVEIIGTGDNNFSQAEVRFRQSIAQILKPKEA